MKSHNEESKNNNYPTKEELENDPILLDAEADDTKKRKRETGSIEVNEDKFLEKDDCGQRYKSQRRFAISNFISNLNFSEASEDSSLLKKDDFEQRNKRRFAIYSIPTNLNLLIARPSSLLNPEGTVNNNDVNNNNVNNNNNVIDPKGKKASRDYEGLVSLLPTNNPEKKPKRNSKDDLDITVDKNQKFSINNNSNSLFSSSILVKEDVIKKFEDYYTKQNYKQVLYCTVENNDDIFIKGARPRSDGIHNIRNMQMNNRMSARLFANENNELYAVYMRDAFKDSSPISALPDGVHAFVIVLTEPNPGKFELQMRVLPKRSSGHPGLLLKEEEEAAQPKALVSAGEIYSINGKVVLSDDKTSFHKYIKSKGYNQKELIDRFIKPYYGYIDKSGSGFFAADENDEVINNELRRRGFPENLIPPPSETALKKGQPKN